jgi:hypothetical protein
MSDCGAKVVFSPKRKGTSGDIAGEFDGAGIAETNGAAEAA